MNERQAWKEFYATGSVTAYLAYAKLAHEQGGMPEGEKDAGKDRRLSDPGMECRGER